MTIDPAKHWMASRTDYLSTLVDLVSRYPHADILELGGGRRPSFELADMPDGIGSYTVNDISQAELALTPAEYRTACFDVSGDATAFAGHYDVVFSRFLAEHVADGRALHRNVWQVLKPGGVAFHLIPTLYASPFVLNALLPEATARRLLTAVFPHRKDKAPKFPAYYSYCRGESAKMRGLFAAIGYSRVDIRPFFGNPYSDKVPSLRGIENFVSGLAARHDWSWYSSYAFITAYK